LILQIQTPERSHHKGSANLSAPHKPGVELRSVGVHYKGVAAIHSIDLTIRDGEFFSLLGPSGCGKTSTLNVIGGFIEPSTGDVLIQEKSVDTYRRIDARLIPSSKVMRCFRT
jgi:ABC-type Fe3+/spermidine/putrescine transport system ATPase subunit